MAEFCSTSSGNWLRIRGSSPDRPKNPAATVIGVGKLVNPRYCGRPGTLSAVYPARPLPEDWATAATEQSLSETPMGIRRVQNRRTRRRHADAGWPHSALKTGEG